MVLLDTEKREEYDEILRVWDGPISADGTPVIRMDDSIRAEMAMKSPEEIEAVFTAQREQAIGLVKHSPKQQAMLGRMLESAGDEDAEELREAYDAALFDEDQILAIEEAERGRLLGLTGNKRYETTLGYAESVQLTIENARTTQTEEYQRRAVGGVSIRLALLAGETPITEQAQDLVTVNSALPHYFDDQAKKISDLAAKREAILEERLRIFQPTYPIAEVQTGAKPNFVIGITNDEISDNFTWIGFNFDPQTVNLENIVVPEEIKDMLASGEYESVYRNEGFNILTFVNKDHIEIQTLLAEAYNKHLQKYYSEVFKD